MISPDMSQYLDVFLDEGREQLVLLESNILEMERGNHTAEMLQTLFRAAHTLKGSSRAMGFLAIGDLTHEMENILDALRLGQIQASTPIVNALLDCLDALGALVDSVGRSGTDTGAPDKDIPALVARLDALRTAAPAPNAGGAGSEEDAASAVPSPLAPPALGAGGAAFPLAAHQQEAMEAARNAGLTVYGITVTLAADCLMKSVRAWMVLAALEPLGTVLAADPSEDALEEEQFDLSFRLLLAAETPAVQIEAALSGISELESVAVQPWESAAKETGKEAGKEAVAKRLPVADAQRSAPAAKAGRGQSPGRGQGPGGGQGPGALADDPGRGVPAGQPAEPRRRDGHRARPDPEDGGGPAPALPARRGGRTARRDDPPDRARHLGASGPDHEGADAAH